MERSNLSKRLEEINKNKLTENNAEIAQPKEAVSDFDNINYSDLIAKADEIETPKATGVDELRVDLKEKIINPNNNRPLKGDELFDDDKEIETKIEQKAKELAAKQEKYLAGIENPVVDDDDSIDNIISNLDSIEVEEDTEDIATLLEKIEAEKIYASFKALPDDKITGPADYIVEKDSSYISTVDNILTNNNITVVKTNATEREAILERITNAGDKVCVALVNSGMFVQLSGAGTTEILAMNSLESEDEVRNELNKLNYVNDHITSSTIGKMKLNQLIKVVSYYDKDSLYYALFAATYPDVTEHTRSCQYCRNDYSMKLPTRDLLLNGEEFVKSSNDIRNNVTTFNRLVETSKLGSVYKKQHSNDMAIYYKHPSIESYLNTLKVLDQTTITKYANIYEIVFGIDKIALRRKGNEVIEITNPNTILDVIATLKDVDAKYDIVDMIESIRPAAVPAYGYHEVVCPHCGRTNPQQAFKMDELLFTLAIREEEMATYRWMARKQKQKRHEDEK